MPHRNTDHQFEECVTIADVIVAHAELSPDTVAILAPGRVPLPYKRLWHQIEYVSTALNRLGLGTGDRIATVLPNGPEMAVAFVAVSASATCAPLNPAYRESEFAFYLSDLRARALIVQEGIKSPARAAARNLGIPIIELSPRRESEAGIFTLLDANGLDTPCCRRAGPNDVALLLHTSGTTSRPKIVPLSHANLCSSAHNIRRTLSLTSADRCLNVMPLFHIHGLIGSTLSSLAAGGSIVCTTGFDLSQFFGWLDAFRPTWYTAVPTMHQSILAHAKDHRQVIARCPLRFIRSSSSPLPPQWIDELERVFRVPVIESYGMTEAAHQMCSNPLPPAERKPGSVGLPAGPEMAIMDEDGILLPAGQTGEIVIRGSNVTAGYANNPEANEAAFSDGWFRTGDLGRTDSDGYFYITGRTKEMINRGGEKISPREIDEVLLEHAAVAQAVAFAVPHPTLGEDVAAAVVLHAESAASESELRRFALERLAPVKVPSRILTVTSIPKGPTGKLQRIGLHKALEDQLRIQYVAPRNNQEKSIVAVIEQILETSRVGVTDNFFALGGDSIKAARVLAQLCSEYQVELPAVSLFLNPTAEKLCLEITRLLGEDTGLLEELLEEIEGMSDEEARRQLG